MRCYNMGCIHRSEGESGNCKIHSQRALDFLCMEFMPSKNNVNLIEEAVGQIKEACDSILKLVEEMKED